jgi:hypothetical protein
MRGYSAADRFRRSNWKSVPSVAPNHNLVNLHRFHISIESPLHYTRLVALSNLNYCLMANRTNPWGPELDTYSRHFDPRVSEVLPSEVERFWDDYKLVPISVLESTLCKSNPRDGPGYGNQPLPAMMLTLRTYLEVHKFSVSLCRLSNSTYDI